MTIYIYIYIGARVLQSQLTTPFPTRIPKPCGIITAVEYFQTCRIRTLFGIIYRYHFFLEKRKRLIDTLFFEKKLIDIWSGHNKTLGVLRLRSIWNC